MNGKPFALMLMAFGCAMIVAAVMQGQGNQGRRTVKGESMDLASTEDAVERYRRALGDKLNQDRIDVQFQNLRDQNVRVDSNTAKREDAVLKGVPLDGERPFPSDPPVRYKNDLSAEIQASVAPEEDLDKWQAEAREKYLAQFIENAREMGYSVKIDSEYNVTYEAIESRMPQNFSLKIPSFLRAPYCH